ncbi:ATP-grasp domain-containing protein [Pseudazoarcus pumilus]|uniref:Carbamoylphosphate synthase large subunit short form n=1 Tax=Pseudazoarcus pumilus TaxID=2067960 RepID=A0A2I6S8C5_9RHOO|nr:ATP-grasp domain-containing protein [Pseudazoarcus pumilus]AUN95514.1 carbamoylphosphate synthase large subunit short form [Pseudazoarcus pumilus]
MKKRVLVFPCGSEIGLEIHRSLRYSTHFELVGASSVNDHGRFVYDEYVGGLPLASDARFAQAIIAVASQYRIDAIYPTMDSVAEIVQNLAAETGIRVIGSGPRATAICASKSATYDLLEPHIAVPKRYASIDEIEHYPIFIKPDRGYGSRNTCRASTRDAAQAFLSGFAPGSMLLLEYLPGREWTIDCFSDRHGKLRFHGVRQRIRVVNGISVNTAPRDDFAEEFECWARTINEVLTPRGAWFFQARRDAAGKPKLLEVAARLGGSSALFRCRGVNFALLSAFDAFDRDVEITPNHYPIELSRALDNRFRIEIEFEHVYVDLDDCLLLGDRINHQLVGFLYKAISEGKRITLLTRHADDPITTLHRLRLGELFDEVVHVRDGSTKADHIVADAAIFIDDSHRERTQVARLHKIPTFSPDMIECLL